MGAEGRAAGAGRGRRRGGAREGGRRSPPSSAPRGRGSRQMRWPRPGAAARLALEALGYPKEEAVVARRWSGAGGLRPRDPAPRGGYSNLGLGSPDTTSTGLTPGAGASCTGKRWPRSDWRNGESSEAPKTLNGI